MLTPDSNTHDEFSPEGEFSEDEIQPIYNEATMNKPMFASEEEWLDTFGGILDIPTIFNPVTMGLVDPDEE